MSKGTVLLCGINEGRARSGKLIKHKIAGIPETISLGNARFTRVPSSCYQTEHKFGSTG